MVEDDGRRKRSSSGVRKKKGWKFFTFFNYGFSFILVVLIRKIAYFGPT
jgi:uncharacterized membrane protein YukC